MLLTNNILLIQQLRKLLQDPDECDFQISTDEIKQQKNTEKDEYQNLQKKVSDSLILQQKIDSDEEYDKLKQVSKIVAEQGMVQNGSGDTKVDEAIAIGFLQVNKGKFGDALNTFDIIINATNPVPLGAYLGKGTAFALLGDLTSAIRVFSIAIDKYPKSDDAWKRRGQARAALGNLTDSIIDLTRAINLKGDGDSYLQRGLIYYKQKNYKKANFDFEKSVELDPTSANAWNQLGLSRTALGNVWDVSFLFFFWFLHFKKF